VGVTGEREPDGPSAGPAARGLEERQPGDRAAAPGELAVVQAFINSHYDLAHEPGADLFATPAGVADWLAGHGLMLAGSRLTGEDRDRAVAVREALRALAAANADAREQAVGPARRALNSAAATIPMRLHFGSEGPWPVPAGHGSFDSALGTVLAIAARAMTGGSWARLKMCPGEDCGWVFYDHSRNGSGRWCSMAVCGGRAKARAHYHRRRGAR
jgi:predicted RNA-binding Zn ribbon-like protein